MAPQESTTAPLSIPTPSFQSHHQALSPTSPSSPSSPLDEITPSPPTSDPFAHNRSTINPFSTSPPPSSNATSSLQLIKTTGTGNTQDIDRRLSDEWDASKTPPSRFQLRRNSIFSTPSSRDSHTPRNSARDAAYHAKLAEKGWTASQGSNGGRRESSVGGLIGGGVTGEEKVGRRGSIFAGIGGGGFGYLV